MSEKVFWAEQLAAKVASRKKFFFLDKPLPKIKGPGIKSSSSLSGVLHIGRLSDILRGEAVFRALKENVSGAKFIYVTEDMDPLRKVPSNVPKSFEQYIGMPVSDVPDPSGCHKSYSLHFKEMFLETFSSFLLFEPKVYSMREEYRKGSFTPFIFELVSKAEEVRKIVDKFKGKNSGSGGVPWKPICDNCGKLQTTHVTSVEGKKISYVCRDYAFESVKALGCGHEGTSDLRKANGKLAWKSEWAAQWKRWNVVSEGAGKEYNAPNSAWFINAEICEKILGFPMPEPIFYEHLLIGREKMSASVGNVVYPHEWLEVARPESLKLLYMKKLSKTRSFSWAELPLLEKELDSAAAIFYSKKKKTDEEKQVECLYIYSQVKGRTVLPLGIDYYSVAALTPVFPDDKALLDKMVSSGQISAKLSASEKKQWLEIISKARLWVKMHATELKLKFSETYSAKNLSEAIKSSFLEIAGGLESKKSEEEVQAFVFSVAKKNSVKPKELFKALYNVVLNADSGPKFGSLVFAFEKKRIAERLREAGGT
ncbi:MAG: lysine--tRNA ligase [Candidatus Diapherotrites archaeon]|uniref:Lysine--tRNA ligase n=1 Tax=Candidatus Iainarchaeum sp. TaxID=3101447 RepID=A0A7J4IT17_9ARCH|nr:MAG: lysyl-tRNA synthetase, class I [archaeon GW2011_AR10]MBS3059168.1 lysine--tRNA ligase [Candidatus Diapherotrites archaeon]HIH07884.1 lysine--tRNA ligase [Candidatus Diapherotrites archaeon]